MRRGLLVFVLCVLAATELGAQRRLFRFRFRATPGTPLSCATSTVRCVPSEYATIDACWEAAAAGDVCWVTAGTYVETPASTHNGTAGNTITFLANGTVTLCGMAFSSNNYIRVIGFTMNPNASSCGGSPIPIVVGAGTNTGLEFWHTTVGDTNGAGGEGYKFDVGSSARCDKCIWVGDTLQNLGDTGQATGLVISGDDDYVSYTNFSTICWLGVGMSGTRQRFINLDFSGFAQCAGTHPDFYYVQGLSALGWSDAVVDGNFGIGTTTSLDNKTFHAQNEQTTAWSDVVWRFNVWHDLGSAAAFSNYLNSGANGAQNRWRFYSNSHIYGDRAQSGSDFSNCGNVNPNGGTITFYVYNSIFYQCWADDATANIIPWATTSAAGADYNLLYTPLGSVTTTAEWTNQAHEQTNVTPNLVNVGNDNFTLGAGSGSGANARGTGGALTTATSCSGTTLNVAANTGSFFVGDNSANLAAYSGALVPGDFLTINSTTYQVVSRSTDALTLSASLSCSSGDAVYFGDSSTIDIGAYPYKAGGYSFSATFAQAGSVVTVTPNDASLIRFVVCYENSIPVAIDNSSPFTCTVGSGVVTVRAYPRYAGQLPYVQATRS